MHKISSSQTHKWYTALELHKKMHKNIKSHTAIIYRNDQARYFFSLRNDELNQHIIIRGIPELTELSVENIAYTVRPVW